MGVVAENGSTVSFIELIPLGLLAFQSGGQIVTSRLLGFNEVPTTVLTSVYCDLASDPKLLAPVKENVKRNRRAAAVVGILVGGVAGGWLSRSDAGMSSALWIGGAIKLSIAVAWSFWRGKGSSDL
jgi:predicted MFS family arabinose efflux permease